MCDQLKDAQFGDQMRIMSTDSTNQRTLRKFTGMNKMFNCQIVTSEEYDGFIQIPTRSEFTWSHFVRWGIANQDSCEAITKTLDLFGIPLLRFQG